MTLSNNLIGGTLRLRRSNRNFSYSSVSQRSPTLTTLDSSQIDARDAHDARDATLAPASYCEPVSLLLASPYMAKLEINPVHRLLYDCVILCHCTLAAALYFEQSSCDELMEFKQIQTRAQPEESLKHNHRQVWATRLCFNDSSGCALV